MRSAFLGATAAALLLAPAVREADAQTQTCQNTISLPGAQTATYSITTKGVYCLTTDVILASGATVGAAIEIAADYVVLDLNGHRVGGSAASAASGILAIGHKGVTVKNGTVRGFDTGVLIEDNGDPASTRGAVVEGIQADANITGIMAQGQGVVIRDNRVLATRAGSQGGFGIRVAGPGARVVDNVVVDTAGTVAFGAVGINLEEAPSALVEGNQIVNAAVPLGTTPTAIAISPVATNTLVVGNRVTGWVIGIGASTTAGAKCRDNSFADVTGATIVGCTDAGNNN